MPQDYQLKELYSQQEHEKVVAFWNQPSEVEQFTEWDYFYCMQSMYKLKRYQGCLEIYRACHKRYPEFDRLDDKLGWSIYQTKVKNFDFQHGDVNALLKQIDYAFEHSQNSPFSPRWTLAKCVMNAVADGKIGQNNANRLALHYLDMVDPNALNAEENQTTDASGKVRRLASDRESWFSNRSKLLLKEKEYELCIKCCDQALNELSTFHSNNDSWFRYRIAKSLYATKRSNEAKAYVARILQGGFSHWCLLQLMFIFEAEAGNEAKALSYAGACALSDPEHKMRVGFYEELADYLARQGEKETSMLLRKFVLLIRHENEWTDKSRHAQWHFSSEIDALNKAELIRRLTLIWKEWRDKDKVFLNGTIDRLMQEGRSGFVVDENNRRYYFRSRDFQRKNTVPKLGMKVRFTLVDRLDKSKGVVRPNAVDLSVL